MNPQQNTPNNYLDQIATPASKTSSVSGKIKLIIIGLVVAIVITIVAMVMINIYNASRLDPWKTLVARLDTTEKIASSATKNIKSSQLRSLNSEIKLFLTDTNNNIQEPLKILKIDKTKLPEDISKKESASSALERLEDARLNAVYDRTYATEMKYQLSILLSSIQQTYQVTSKAEIKQFLDKSYTSLKATHDSLANYSAANSKN